MPSLLDALKPCAWHFDRDFLLPDRRLTVFLARPGASVPIEWILKECRSSVQRLALEPEVPDSHLVSLPPNGDSQGTEGNRSDTGARVSVQEAAEGDGSEDIVSQRSSEHAVELLAACVDGVLSRKTLAPTHVAILLESYAAGERFEPQQWLASCAKEVLLRMGRLALQQSFDDKLGDLLNSRKFLFRKNFTPPYRDQCSAFQRCLPKATLPLATLPTVILRHLARLGFGSIEAAYILTLAQAEFDIPESRAESRDCRHAE